MVWGSTPAGGIFLFLLFGRFVFVLFCFVLFFLANFHILRDLNYTGRLIASSLSAFISKIINPRVSHRHPLIALSVDTYNCFVA